MTQYRMEVVMIRIAICDDSSTDAKRLRSVCESCDLPDTPEFKIYHYGQDLLAELAACNFDIIFLDIDMPEYNGIRVGKAIRQIKETAIIIFCTSYPQYAIEAYDCEAFHYILKPCTRERIQGILIRAINKLGLIRKYHSIKIHNKTIKVPISNIYYIEYCQKHVIYHLTDQKIETTGKFVDIYDELKKFGFYQIHQGYIVNFEKIRDFAGYTAILDDGRDVLISVRKKSEVLLAYAKYVEKLT